MKISKQLLLSSAAIIIGLLTSGALYADTCYDPNNDVYYNCEADDYVTPAEVGLLFGVIAYGDNQYYNNGRYYNNNHHQGHGYYHGSNNSHGNFGGSHGGGGGHGGGGHQH